MEPVKNFRGKVAVLDRANVDTDAIIPKQFLKSIARTGFGENLFFDWRYLPDGKVDPSFILNDPRYQGASLLVARNNFGCGSSREHAVWAIQQYGFKAVIAPWQERGGSRVPGFADIFRNNCGKNAVLAIELSEQEVETIFRIVTENPGLEATVDLPAQQVSFHLPQSVSFSFQMDPSLKDRLIRGLDDIGITLRYQDAIQKYEAAHSAQKYY